MTIADYFAIGVLIVLALCASGAAALRRQVMNSLSVGAPNEQFIGLTNQVTAGLLGLTRREFLVTPMPKNAGEKRQHHI
jgi:tetrahydromethanopterin S-methyltransferase subunit C